MGVVESEHANMVRATVGAQQFTGLTSMGPLMSGLTPPQLRAMKPPLPGWCAWPLVNTRQSLWPTGGTVLRTL